MFELKVKPTVCVSCTGKYIRTMGKEQETCIKCFRAESNNLTYRLKERNACIEKNLAKFGKKSDLLCNLKTNYPS